MEQIINEILSLLKDANYPNNRKDIRKIKNGLLEIFENNQSMDVSRVIQSKLTLTQSKIEDIY